MEEKEKMNTEEEVKEEAQEVKEENAEELAKDTPDATDEAKTQEKETKKEKKQKHKDEVAELKAKLEEADKKYAELQNKYLMVYAEMENTKKRLKEDAIKDRKYASQKVVGELINPIDMLVQVVNMPVNSPELQNYLYGFQMIANQISDVMKNEGLSPIVALDKEFDPKVMQAVNTEWNPDKKEGIVLKVQQHGYMYKDRVLRPAMVVVNKKAEEPKEEKEKVEE